MTAGRAGRAVAQIRRELGTSVLHSPLCEIVGEVLGPEGIYEVLSCGHIRVGQNDPGTGMPTAYRRRCLPCLRSAPLTPLEAFTQALGEVDGPVEYPLDPRWEVAFVVTPTEDTR